MNKSELPTIFDCSSYTWFYFIFVSEFYQDQSNDGFMVMDHTAQTEVFINIKVYFIIIFNCVWRKHFLHSLLFVVTRRLAEIFRRPKTSWSDEKIILIICSIWSVQRKRLTTLNCWTRKTGFNCTIRLTTLDPQRGSWSVQFLIKTLNGEIWRASTVNIYFFCQNMKFRTWPILHHLQQHISSMFPSFVWFNWKITNTSNCCLFFLSLHRRHLMKVRITDLINLVIFFPMQRVYVCDMPSRRSNGDFRVYLGITEDYITDCAPDDLRYFVLRSRSLARVRSTEVPVTCNSTRYNFYINLPYLSVFFFECTLSVVSGKSDLKILTLKYSGKGKDR